MKRLIAIVGMSGAGKSAAGEFFKTKGFPVLRMGSAVDDGLKEDGLSWTPENTALYRKKIRDELGMAAVAIKMLPKIKQAFDTHDSVVLDGLYSWEEYKFLKEKQPTLTLVCIYARPAVRYKRLNTRSERPFTDEEAHERDISEIEVTNKGGPIALADYLIKNESTREEFITELEKIYEDFL